MNLQQPAHSFTATLNATTMLIHSCSTWQLNPIYLQENSMNHYLTKLKMILFFLKFSFHMAFWNIFFDFFYSVLLFLICTYITGVCNFLRLASLVDSFAWINFHSLSFPLVRYVNVLSVQIEKLKIFFNW